MRFLKLIVIGIIPGVVIAPLYLKLSQIAPGWDSPLRLMGHVIGIIVLCVIVLVVLGDLAYRLGFIKPKPSIDGRALLARLMEPGSVYGIDSVLKEKLGTSNIEYLEELDDIGWHHLYEDLDQFMKENEDWRDKTLPMELVRIKAHESSDKIIWTTQDITAPPKTVSRKGSMEYLDNITPITCSGFILARFDKAIGLIGHNGIVENGEEKISEITVIGFLNNYTAS